MAYKQIPRSPVEKPGDRIKALIAKWKAKKESEEQDEITF